MPDLTKYQTCAPIIRDLWQDLMEKDDRNSPAEYPEMCLVTFEEFAGYLEASAAQANAEVERLNGLVYVPGVWRCAKCDFRLIQSNLNANTGNVTARDTSGDKCPNCNSPLWRLTERQERSEALDLVEKQFARSEELEKALKDLIRAYVNLLEIGRDRITSLGGTCDTVEKMETGDPWLIAAKAALHPKN